MTLTVFCQRFLGEILMCNIFTRDITVHVRSLHFVEKRNCFRMKYVLIGRVV